MAIEPDYLKDFRFFEGFSSAQLKVITSISSKKEFKVRDILFEQYDQLSELFVLLEGSLSLGISITGKKRIHLGSILEGQLFSWSAIFPSQLSTAWVMACGPVSVLSMDVKKLRKEFDMDPELGYKFMEKIAKTISQRLHDTRFHLLNRVTV